MSRKTISEIFHFNQISTKITSLIVLILILTFGSYTAFVILFGQYHSKKSTVSQTSFLAKTIERILRINMLENHREDIRTTIYEIQKDDAFSGVRIIDHISGRIAYATDSLLLNTFIDVENKPCRSCHAEGEDGGKIPVDLDGLVDFEWNSNEISVNVPVYNSEQCRNAFCHIHLPEQTVLGILSINVNSQRAIADLKFSSITLAIISLVIIPLSAVIVFLLLQHWVWRPVKNLVEATERIASGNFDDYEVIRQQALRSRDIVRKILNFARQDEPERKLISINSIIENNLGLVRRLSQFHNIQIITKLDKTTPELLVDPGQIEQVILNILLNSTEAITSGGKIEIETRLDVGQENLVIIITDNGVGIEPENLTKIFDPFFTTKENAENPNSGLGLSVSWGIIEQHGGKSEVESKLGQGTTFRILLPAESE